MTKHSPGPWTTGDADWRTIVGSQTRFRGKSLAAVAIVDTSDDEQEDIANARLIAAAPDLLEENKHTLRNLESMIHMLPLSTPEVERRSLEAWASRTRAAIAKAGGGL